MRRTNKSNNRAEEDRALRAYLEELADRIPRTYGGVFSYKTLKETLKYFNRRTPDFDWSVFQAPLETIAILLVALMFPRPDGSAGSLANVAALAADVLTSVIVIGVVVSLAISFSRILNEVKRAKESPRLRIKGSYKDFRDSDFIKNFLKAKNSTEIEAFLRSDLARKYLSAIVYYQ